MKLTVKGQTAGANVALALSDTLRSLDIDTTRFILRGATVYFNLYDRETGHMVEPAVDGTVVEEVLWLPADMPDAQQARLAQRAKAGMVVITHATEPRE